MSVMNQTRGSGVEFADAGVAADAERVASYFENEHEVLSGNLDAMRVQPDDLTAFLELAYATDPEYIDVQEYVPEPGAMLDWDLVSAALNESQEMLVVTQELLSQTLEDMGIEDYAAIRVYSDEDGALRLVVDHPRQAEIEAELNGEKNTHLRELYKSATEGLSIAGSLVGCISVPEEVLERVRGKYAAAI